MGTKIDQAAPKTLIFSICYECLFFGPDLFMHLFTLWLTIGTLLVPTSTIFPIFVIVFNVFRVFSTDLYTERCSDFVLNVFLFARLSFRDAGCVNVVMS